MKKTPKILSAIAGDVIGSVYEWKNIKTKDFPLFQPQSCFTDDTVLTVAIADAILEGKGFAESLWEYGNRYPDSGYGGRFREWLKNSGKEPYGSFGNGSAIVVVFCSGFALILIFVILHFLKIFFYASRHHY